VIQRIGNVALAVGPFIGLLSAIGEDGTPELVWVVVAVGVAVIGALFRIEAAILDRSRR